MNVHIFCNNDTSDFPTDNGWEKFPGHLEEIRLFNFAARTWERQGWKVHRLSTKTLPESSRLNFFEDGNGPVKARWYPSEYWQYLAAVREVIRNDPEGIHLFTSLDVQNICFTPESVRSVYSFVPIFINYQTGHFSLSTFQCNQEWIEWACNFLLAYDGGFYPTVGHPYVSDEMILREYAPTFTNVFNTDIQKFPPEVGSLIHHARSTLRDNFNRYPTSPYADKNNP